MNYKYTMISTGAGSQMYGNCEVCGKPADAMKDSKYLECITLTLTENGETDIPERDIELAYRDITGGYIHPLEWD